MVVSCRSRSWYQFCYSVTLFSFSIFGRFWKKNFGSYRIGSWYEKIILKMILGWWNTGLMELAHNPF